jgi:hypothetical protein
LSEIDEFASSLLEESKRFLEKAQATSDDDAERAFLHASLMLAFCSLEAHVNAVADEISERPGISVHDRGILLERDVSLEKGEFTLGKGRKISRLEERMLVLHRLGLKPDPTGKWAGVLAGATVLRNKLTHPKMVPNITVAATVQALEAVIDAIDSLYRSVYNKEFPAANRRLQSKLTF